MRAMLRLLQPDIPYLTMSFYALIAWGLAAMFSAFRVLADDKVRDGVIFRGGLLVWMFVPWFFAMNGTLSDFSANPPYLMRIMLPMVLIIVGFCFSPWGRKVAERLPITLLVGSQIFRLPLEFLLYTLAARSILPEEMTMKGYNFDVVTGATALPLWLMLHMRSVPYWAVWAWNIIGLTLLLTIMFRARASPPTASSMRRTQAC